jgi:hypothetical protein
VVTGSRRGARPGLAVMSADGNEVGIELRSGGAAAWRSVEGHRTEPSVLDSGCHTTVSQDSRLPQCRRSEVALRVSVGERVRLAVKTRGPWRAVGPPQPLPRWASGARVALTVAGPPGARGRFDSLSIDPR